MDDEVAAPPAPLLPTKVLVKEVCRLIRAARSHWDAHHNAAARLARGRAIKLYELLSPEQRDQVPQALRVWLRYRSEKYYGSRKSKKRGSPPSKGAPRGGWGDIGMRVRELSASDSDSLEWVAGNMRKTLLEVVGQDLYSMEQLRDRVRFHLDPSRSRGQVFICEAPGGQRAGHTIVRVELDADGGELGLFSTTYVEPEHRRCGVADLLLATGEAWMRRQGMLRAATDTSEANEKLIALYSKHGYGIVLRDSGMIRLARFL